MASFKKLLTSVRPSKATRPASMRSYRVAAALPMELKHQVEPVVVEAPEAVRVRAERDRSARVQQQWVISFVIIIGMLALLAGLYLNITATASIAGRQIQSIGAEITANEQINADLETRIAGLMSNAVLEQRAVALGYIPVERTTIQYMVVPGYFPPQPVNMVSAASPSQVVSASPEFNETLIDWLARQIEVASIPLLGSNH